MCHVSSVPIGAQVKVGFLVTKIHRSEGQGLKAVGSVCISSPDNTIYKSIMLCSHGVAELAIPIGNYFHMMVPLGSKPETATGDILSPSCL